MTDGPPLDDDVYLSVVIPCYNEEGRLGGSLLQIRDYLGTRPEPMEVIVVDDGSRDRTSEVAREFAEGEGGVRLVAVRFNRGKGAAVRHGFLEARGSRVLISDADLSTPIEDVERLERALDGGVDIAFGSRALPSSQVVVHQPWWRERMGKTFNLLVRHLTGLDVHDSQCGFKLFDRAAAEPLFRAARIRGFSFDVEILVLARRFGLRWEEVPVRWYNSPESKIHPLVHSAQMFRDLVRIRLWAATGAYGKAVR